MVLGIWISHLTPAGNNIAHDYGDVTRANSLTTHVFLVRASHQWELARTLPHERAQLVIRICQVTKEQNSTGVV